MKIKESEKVDEYLDFAREQKKVVEHDCDGETIILDALRTVPKRLRKKMKELEITEKIETI